MRRQKNQEHRRSLEKNQARFKMGFFVIFFVAGMSMIIGGLTEIGVITLGASMFGVVPDYVKMFFRISREKDKGGENAEE